MVKIELGKTLLKEGNNPDCIHEEWIGWNKKYKKDMIGICKKCGQVTDYNLLQNRKHLTGIYPNRVYQRHSTPVA